MAKIDFKNENCFSTLNRMISEDKQVDLIITSPPYATSRSNVKTDKALKIYNRRYDICTDNMDTDEYRNWTVRLFNYFDKVLIKNGVVLYNVSYGSENPSFLWLSLLSVIENTNFMIADTIVWKKKSAFPNNTGNKLTRITEFVFVICRKDEYKTFNINKKVKSVRKDTGQKYYENMYNFIEAPNNDGPCNLNKATYSSDLCIKLLDMYARKDSKIYDPFMGTGTTAIACEKWGNEDMICIGSELSEAQVRYSKDRLNNFRKDT